MPTIRLATERAVLFLVVLTSASIVHAEDWPMFGRDQTRNAVSPEKNPPLEWQIKDGKQGVDKNIKWTAPLGSSSDGCPVVSDGMVWLWTNNRNLHDPRAGKRDAGVLLCLRESDGAFLYSFTSPLRGNLLSDWSSFASVPLVEGDRLWFVSNNCEVLCLDIGPLKRKQALPKILWKLNLLQECNVFRLLPPQFLICSIGASYCGRIYVTTGDQLADNERPDDRRAPSLVCLDKNNGKILWQDRSTGQNYCRSQWGSPLVVEINGRGQVITPQGDGWLRSLDALTGKLIWKFDGNPKNSKYRAGGNGATRASFVATPVYYQGRIYIGTGLDAEQYEGIGHLYCIDPTRTGDISPEIEVTPGVGKPNPHSGAVWHYHGPRVSRNKTDPESLFERTPCTCVVHDGLVYIADIAGIFHCLDSSTGQQYWEHDMKEMVMGSACWVDGWIYQATMQGDVWIFAHGKTKKEPRKVEMQPRISSSPIFANGVLYIARGDRLLAIQRGR